MVGIRKIPSSSEESGVLNVVSSKRIFEYRKGNKDFWKTSQFQNLTRRHKAFIFEKNFF